MSKLKNARYFELDKLSNDHNVEKLNDHNVKANSKKIKGSNTKKEHRSIKTTISPLHNEIDADNEAIKTTPTRPKVIDKKTLVKYTRGYGVEMKHLKKGAKQHRILKKEKIYKYAEEESARTEVLLPESTGLLEATETSYSSHITQREIKDNVDISAATKGFSLNLDQFGPYRFRYSQDGRHMVLGGRKGHLASFDWVTKKLHCERNVMESIHDVCYLHTEQMIATAQKEWVHIYDNQGVELHCLKKLDRVLSLEFLPYHFLLCSGSETGYLSWLDVSLGQEVIQFPTRNGRLEVMCQNPSNAVICCGHTNGTVTMWTPNCKDPALSMFCHPQAIRAVAVDPSGRYLSTGCVDRKVRIWDTRNLGRVVSSYLMSNGVNKLAYSQTNLLAVSSKDIVEVYKNVSLQDDCEIYMRHNAKSLVTDLQFCPYEDILGCALSRGFCSLIIPGSGEPNFDALEANPFRSVSARREGEVKALLEKIPSDFITLDPATIGQVDVPTLEEKLEARKQIHWVKAPKVNAKPRYRMKGKSGSAQRFKRKMQIQQREKRQFLQFVKDRKDKLMLEEAEEEITTETSHVLDRFKSKRKSIK